MTVRETRFGARFVHLPFRYVSHLESVRFIDFAVSWFGNLNGNSIRGLCLYARFRNINVDIADDCKFWSSYRCLFIYQIHNFSWYRWVASYLYFQGGLSSECVYKKAKSFLKPENSEPRQARLLLRKHRCPCFNAYVIVVVLLTCALCADMSDRCSWVWGEYLSWHLHPIVGK